MTSKRVDRLASMVSTMFEVSNPESDCKVRACSLAVRDELLVSLLVGLAAAAAATAAIDALSAIDSKRVCDAVVVTAREYPGRLQTSTSTALVAAAVVVVVEPEEFSLPASPVTILKTGSVAVDGVVGSSSAAHLSWLLVP